MSTKTMSVFAYELVVFIAMALLFSVPWYVGDDGRVFLTCNFIFCWIISYRRSKVLLEYYTHILTVFVYYLCISVIVSVALRHPHLFFISTCSGIGWLFWITISHYIRLRVIHRPYTVLVHPDIADQLPENEKVRCIVKSSVQPEDLLGVDLIVVDQTYAYEESWLNLIAHAGISSVTILALDEYDEMVEQRLSLKKLDENWLYAGFSIPAWYRFLKSFLDSLMTILLAPILIVLSFLISMLVLLSMGRPIFFSQKRVGLNGKEFNIYKFRTMITTAQQNTAKFAKIDDERVTTLGAFLRRFRLDELPQFWNVLKGDMSLIGPRPEQKMFAIEYAKEIPLYRLRHIIKPGISGWAQVHQGYTDGTEVTHRKLQYDLYYVKNVSLIMDLKVFIKTIYVILTGFGYR